MADPRFSYPGYADFYSLRLSVWYPLLSKTPVIRALELKDTQQLN